MKHHAYLGPSFQNKELTTKILRVHGEGHPELQGPQTFPYGKMELEEHLVKEETYQYWQ